MNNGLSDLEPYDVIQVLESDDELLNELCPYAGIPLWLRIRELFYFSCGQMTYPIPAPNETHPTPNLKTHIKNTIGGAHNLFSGKNPPILFMPPAGTLNADMKNSDISGMAKLASHSPKHCGLLIDVDTHQVSDLGTRCASARKFFSKIKLYQKQRIDTCLLKQDAFYKSLRNLKKNVDQRLEQHFGIRVDAKLWTQIKNFLLIDGKKLQGATEAWETLLRQMKPRCLIIEDGPYLSQQAILFAARRANILSADLQHGSLIYTHPIYNFGTGIKNSNTLPSYLPDLFLARGTHWTKQTNLPWRSVVIGHANRPKQVTTSQQKNSKRVMVIGQIPSSTYLKIAVDLCNMLPADYHVIFRPHPSQRNAALSHLPQTDRFHLDNGQPLFKALEDVAHVVGEHSTVMFEALGIVPNIHIRKTPATKAILDEFPFESFSDANGLAHSILQSKATTIQPDQFWAVDWESNLEKFISKIL